MGKQAIWKGCGHGAALVLARNPSDIFAAISNICTADVFYWHQPAHIQPLPLWQPLLFLIYASAKNSIGKKAKGKRPAAAGLLVMENDNTES